MQPRHATNSKRNLQRLSCVLEVCSTLVSAGGAKARLAGGCRTPFGLGCGRLLTSHCSESHPLAGASPSKQDAVREGVALGRSSDQMFIELCSLDVEKSRKVTGPRGSRCSSITIPMPRQRAPATCTRAALANAAYQAMADSQGSVAACTHADAIGFRSEATSHRCVNHVQPTHRKPISYQHLFKLTQFCCLSIDNTSTSPPEHTESPLRRLGSSLLRDSHVHEPRFYAVGFI